MTEDFLAKLKTGFEGYTTFPEFKKTPSPAKTLNFFAYINRNNALGALKVLSYIAFAIPLGIGYGLNYGFNSIKNKYGSLSERNIKVAGSETGKIENAAKNRFNRTLTADNSSSSSTAESSEDSSSWASTTESDISESELHRWQDALRNARMPQEKIESENDADFHSSSSSQAADTSPDPDELADDARSNGSGE